MNKCIITTLLLNNLNIIMKSNKKVYLLLAGILGLLVAAYFLFVYVFPSIAIKFVSEDREVAMGNELYQQWVANQEINQEATLAIQDFANQLKLSRNYPIKVTVINAEEVNAFAMPGGHIVVNAGLLEKLYKPESLVALLGHEATHINQRHSLHNILESMSTGFLLSFLTRSGGGISQFVIGNVNTLRELHYSRQLEAEADREGMMLMAKNKIDPRGMLALMQTLKEVDQDNGMPQISFLSTHPLTDNRIRDAETYLSLHPFEASKEMNWNLIYAWRGIRGAIERKE
jgi:predicted Zn-dependent protease